MRKSEYSARVALVMMMLGVAAMVWAPRAHAQREIELTPQVGWMWGGTLRYGGGDVHVPAAASFGGTIGTELRPGYFGELTYWYQGSQLDDRPNIGSKTKIGDIGTHYVQVAARRTLGFGDSNVNPFLTGGIGLAIFSLSNAGPGAEGTTVASFSIGGGFIADVSEKVALRAQARLLLPTRLWGTGLWFGTGGGGVSVSGTSIAQGDATLGVVLKLGS